MAKKILVVDDDVDSLELYVIGLEEAGYQLHSARDGQEALVAARSFRPDLMVLDLSMPRMHGYEVVERIRADAELKGTRIVVTSGKSFPVDIRTSQKVGADRYMVKPIDVKELARVIEEVLAPR